MDTSSTSGANNDNTITDKNINNNNTMTGTANSNNSSSSSGLHHRHCASPRAIKSTSNGSNNTTPNKKNVLSNINNINKVNTTINKSIGKPSLSAFPSSHVSSVLPTSNMMTTLTTTTPSKFILTPKRKQTSSRQQPQQHQHNQQQQQYPHQNQQMQHPHHILRSNHHSQNNHSTTSTTNGSTNSTSKNNNHNIYTLFRNKYNTIDTANACFRIRKNKQKWLLRCFLLIGGMLYFIIMIRGTQLVVQHSSQNNLPYEQDAASPPTLKTQQRKQHQQHERPNAYLRLSPASPPLTLSLLPPLMFGSNGNTGRNTGTTTGTAVMGGLPSIEQQQQPQLTYQHQDAMGTHLYNEHQSGRRTSVADSRTVRIDSTTTNIGDNLSTVADAEADAAAMSRIEAKRLVQTQILGRAHRRRQLTRPKMQRSVNGDNNNVNDKHNKQMDNDFSHHQFVLHHEPDQLQPLTSLSDSTDTTSANHNHNRGNKHYRPATIQELCGYNARNASISHPNMYLKRDALNSHSKVIITGILSNPIAWHLALFLKHRCGVQTMLGVDSQYNTNNNNPISTISKRLQHLVPYEILTTNIPQLQQPIIIPLVGLDPKRKKTSQSSTTKNSAVQEYDWMSFQPTHIVHLATASATASTTPSSVPDWDWKNLLSPYVSPDYDPPLFMMRTSMTSMEQLFSSIINSTMSTASHTDASTTTKAAAASKQNDTTATAPLPHVTYASSSILSSSSSPPSTVSYDSSNSDKNYIIHNQCKLIDEVLAQTYQSLFHTYSVGVRLPSTVYGPWDMPESQMYQFFSNSIQLASSENTGTATFTNANTLKESLYVQDAVEALVAAMQFRASQSTFFDIPSSSDSISMKDASVQVQEYLKGKRGNGDDVEERQLLDVEQTRNLKSITTITSNINNRTLNYLGWKPTIPLKLGFLKSLAWHLDQLQPYGPPQFGTGTDDGVRDRNSTGTGSSNKDPGQSSSILPPSASGDALLMKHNVSTCKSDDLTCHTGREYLPCVSECSNKHQCLPSIWDGVWELTRNMTEGCDAILYTQSLGLIPDLNLQAQYDDEDDEDNSKIIICNIAFVNRDSPMVNAVIERVPARELDKLGVKTSTTVTNNVDNSTNKNERLDKLNGRLLYRGWILIWVDVPQLPSTRTSDDGNEQEASSSTSTPIVRNDTLTVADKFLLKLNPGKFFSKDASFAVFIDENFTVSPTIDDIRFLVSQMHRTAYHQRSIWVPPPPTDESTSGGHDDNKKTKKIKYTIPAEPKRRASILLSELKYKLSPASNSKQQQQYLGLPKISVVDAATFMRFEIGHNLTEKEPVEIKRQKEFYKRLPSYLNNKDLKPIDEPLYKYEMKHWIRSRWIVHDLKLEHSRLLRCDWYQEHVQWKSDLDQLSFASIMALREVSRRINNQEMDDHVKSKLDNENDPILRQVSDANEWYTMDMSMNALGGTNSHNDEKSNKDDDQDTKSSMSGIQQPERVPHHVAEGEDDEDEEIVIGVGSTTEAKTTTSEMLIDTTGSMSTTTTTNDNHDENNPLYVRIISDRIMSLSRKAWAAQQQELKQQQQQLQQQQQNKKK